MILFIVRISHNDFIVCTSAHHECDIGGYEHYVRVQYSTTALNE